MYTINASHLDTINMLQHRRKMLGEVSTKTKVIEEDLNSLSKKELISILEEVDDYHFDYDHIIYTRKLTDAEIAKEVELYNKGIRYDISRLKKWSERSEKSYDQIVGYLNRHNIEVETLNI